MSEIRLVIDGKEVRAQEGMTLLQAAQSVGVQIPTLCYHEKLAPFGGCRICIVETELAGHTRLLAACVHPVEHDLVVKTRTPKVDKIRKNLLELLLAHAPDAPVLQTLASEYGADKDRFEKDASFCIHCGLCVRYCDEVKQKNAVTFVDRGIRKEISFLPQIAKQECNPCKECFELCPTSYLQAVFVLTQSMAFDSDESACSSPC